MRNKVVPNTAQDDEPAPSASLAQPEFVDGCEVFSPECFCESNRDANGEENAKNCVESTQQDAQLPSDDEETGAWGRRGIYRSFGGASNEAGGRRSTVHEGQEEHEEFHKEHHLANIVGLVSSRGLSSSAHESEQILQRKRKLNATAVLSSAKMKRTIGQTVGQGLPSSWLDDSVGTSGGAYVAGEFEQTIKRKVQSELGRWAYNTLKCCICADRLQLNEQSVEVAAKAFSEHPVLGVPCCFKCVRMYLAEMATERFTPDSDGNHTACTWCACGGKLVLCDVCPRAFCRKCLRSQLGRTYSARFDQMDENVAWRCLVCQPPPELQAMQVSAHEMLEAVRRECERIRERKATKTLSQVNLAKRSHDVLQQEPQDAEAPSAPNAWPSLSAAPIKNKPKARQAKSRSARSTANRKLSPKDDLTTQPSVVLYDSQGNAYCMVQPVVHAPLGPAFPPPASVNAPIVLTLAQTTSDPTNQSSPSNTNVAHPINTADDDKECQQAYCISSACILHVETTLAQLRELNTVISNTSLPLATRRKQVRRFFTLLSSFVHDLGDVDSLEAEGRGLVIARNGTYVNAETNSLPQPLITVSNVMSASKIAHVSSDEIAESSGLAKTTTVSTKALFTESNSASNSRQAASESQSDGNLAKSTAKQVQLDAHLGADSANFTESATAARPVAAQDEDCIVLDDSDDERAAYPQSPVRTSESAQQNLLSNVRESSEEPLSASATIGNRNEPDINDDQSDEDLFSVVHSDDSAALVDVSASQPVQSESHSAAQLIQSPALAASDSHKAAKAAGKTKKKKVLESSEDETDNRVLKVAKRASASAKLNASTLRTAPSVPSAQPAKSSSESDVLPKKNSNRNARGRLQGQHSQLASPSSSETSESPKHAENASLATPEQALGGLCDTMQNTEPFDGLSYYDSKLSGWVWRKPTSHITKALHKRPRSLLRSCGIALLDFRKQYPSVRMSVKGMTVKLDEWERATSKR